jgi:hypothetical protein
MKTRWDDLMSIKITKGMIWAGFVLLASIIGWFIRGWMNDVELSKEACAANNQRLEKRIIPLETTLPMIVETVKRIEYKLDKHIIK